MNEKNDLLKIVENKNEIGNKRGSSSKNDIVE